MIPSNWLVPLLTLIAAALLVLATLVVVSVRRGRRQLQRQKRRRCAAQVTGATRTDWMGRSYEGRAGGQW